MKKTMQLKWFLSVIKLIGMLAIPTLLCGIIFSFNVAFKAWALILAFLIPFMGGLLIIFNNVWKNQTLASFLHAVVLGISIFTTSIVGIAINFAGLRELLPFILGITVDGRAIVWHQVLFTSAIVGFIVFVGVIFSMWFARSIRLIIKEVVKDVMKE